MRVLFLTLYPPAAASPRYRVHQFFPALESAGIEPTVWSAVDESTWRRHSGPDRVGRAGWYHVYETKQRLGQLFAARPFDVVVLQKAVMSAYVRGLAGLLRSRAKRLVYDIDAAVHLEPPHPLRHVWRSFEDREQVKKIAASADAVWAGNYWLVDELRDNPGVSYRPTVVDTDRFTPPSKRHDDFHVGWIGSPSTVGSLKLLGDTLGMQGVEIRFMGGAPPPTGAAEFSAEPWTFAGEVAFVQQLSVGLMPLPDTPWSRGKCALKALQYMACGVPCIASPVGAACDVIEDGVNGLFAQTPDDWRNAIASLRDRARRKAMGEAARATVEENFSLKRAAPRMVAALEALA